MAETTTVSDYVEAGRHGRVEMATLVAITFEDQESAGNVLRRIRQLEREGKIRLADTAVLVRERDGRIHTENELDSGVETGAVVGGILGMALSFMFPVAGLVVGVAGGALVGRMLEQGVDQGLVREVRDHLQPGTSALFLMVQDSDAGAVVAAVRPERGQVYQSALSYETEQALRQALGERV
jgi:uncharacterized membrane protein